MSSSLPSDLASFVEQQVSSGQFGSADEVIVAGLRALQVNQKKSSKNCKLKSRKASTPSNVASTSHWKPRTIGTGCEKRLRAKG